MTRIRAIIAILSSALILFFLTPSLPAHAGVFDRIKDIYNTPDKINQLEQQYIDAKEQLEDTIKAQQDQFEATLLAQKKQLDEALEKAAELTAQQEELLMQNKQIQQLNSQYMQQNDQLAEQNAALLNELEQAKQRKDSFWERLLKTALIAFALIAAYFAALRIWRFMTWRRNGYHAGRGMH